MHYFGTDYESAEAFLQGGRRKTYRPLSRNTYVARVDEHTIALVYQNTAVVAYHSDGTQTLNTDDWLTVTTKARISTFSKVNVRSTYDRKYPGWTFGWTGEYTPSRVQKCRTCRGEGGWVRRRVCYGAPSWLGDDYAKANRCDGPKTEYAVAWNVGKIDKGTDNWDEHYASRYVVPCEHGAQFEKSHKLVTCAHGQMREHEYGEIYAAECGRCEGTGIREYGNQPIPLVWDGSPVRITEAGDVVEWNAPRVPTPPRPYTPKGVDSEHWWGAPSHSHAYVEAKHAMGAETKHRLEAVVPGLKVKVKCPGCTSTEHCADKTVSDMIVHLNDNKHWSREQIADWLDTLDADLRFPTPKG